MSAPGDRWWGWGEGAHPVRLPSGAAGLLAAELGAPERPPPPVRPDGVELPAPRPLPPALAGALGADSLLTGAGERLRRAAGRGYPDLIRLRGGRLERAPDAVALPAGGEQVRRVLEVCQAEGVAVVPFGGGTSVVGGVEPLGGGFERVLSLDLARLRRVEVDRRSLTAALGPGLRGPEAERALAAEGLTLGHFPQSFERATIGGFAATRSAGQASSGYGRFDELVVALRLVTPAGEIATIELPHTAAGPSLRELALGSEGVLGVIAEVRVRVRPAPERRLYAGWMLRDFAGGAELLRRLAQADALPDVTRLSDERETRLSLALAGAETLPKRLARAYLRARGRERGCLLIAGFEGEREAVARRRARAERLIRAAGAVALGRAAGRAWLRGRYQGPYLRDELIDRGYLVETLETAHTWSGLAGLYAAAGGAIGAALEAQGTPGLVMCHISHVYRDGASLYFTFLARARPGEEIAQWRAVKAAASEAIVARRGTITHHHAVGRDHAPYLAAEIGDLGVEALRAVKQRLDPAGIMNPGKLLPG